jgi:hypothetical protein
MIYVNNYCPKARSSASTPCNIDSTVTVVRRSRGGYAASILIHVIILRRRVRCALGLIAYRPARTCHWSATGFLTHQKIIDRLCCTTTLHSRMAYEPVRIEECRSYTININTSMQHHIDYLYGMYNSRFGCEPRAQKQSTHAMLIIVRKERLMHLWAKTVVALEAISLLTIDCCRALSTVCSASVGS